MMDYKLLTKAGTVSRLMEWGKGDMIESGWRCWPRLPTAHWTSSSSARPDVSAASPSPRSRHCRPVSRDCRCLQHCSWEHTPQTYCSQSTSQPWQILKSWTMHHDLNPNFPYLSVSPATSRRCSRQFLAQPRFPKQISCRQCWEIVEISGWLTFEIVLFHTASSAHWSLQHINH